MLTFLRSCRVLVDDRRGVTAVEYGIMAALIAVALVTAVGSLTSGLTSAFTGLGSELTTASNK